ncbi:hypothetical protein H4I96_03602 [Botrytis cinerea]
MHIDPVVNKSTVAEDTQQHSTVSGVLGALRIQTNIDNGKIVEDAQPPKRSAGASSFSFSQQTSLYPIIEWVDIPDSKGDPGSRMSIDTTVDTQALESRESQDEIMNNNFQQTIVAGPASFNDWPKVLDATRQQNTTTGLSQSLPQSDTAASANSHSLQFLTYFHDWSKQYNRTLEEVIEETHKIKDYVREYTVSAGKHTKIGSHIFDIDSKIIQEYREWDNDYKHLVAKYHSIMDQHATLYQTFDDRYNAGEEDFTAGYTFSNSSNADPQVSSQKSAESPDEVAVNLGTINSEDLMDGLTTTSGGSLTHIPTTASDGLQIDCEKFRLYCHLSRCDNLVRMRSETIERLASLRILAVRLLEDDDFLRDSHVYTLWFNCQAKCFSIAEDLERLQNALKQFG